MTVNIEEQRWLQDAHIPDHDNIGHGLGTLLVDLLWFPECDRDFFTAVSSRVEDAFVRNKLEAGGGAART